MAGKHTDETGGNPEGVTERHDHADPETTTGTFYVKYAAEDSVTLHDVDTGRVFALTENPGVEKADVIEATLVARPPMELSYRVDDLGDRYSIPVETSPEPPTRQAREIAAETDETRAVTVEREGKGEIHVLRVPPEDVDRTVDELREDEATYRNAARYGVDRVEIRADESGVVSVRYLP